jgi:putative membrane protein
MRGMTALATVLVLLVALLHVGFLVLEMVLFTTPRGRAIFGTTVEEAETMKVLAANQGLYNGFLAAGLVWGVLSDDPTGFRLQVGFLVFVIIAGVYGAATVSTRILVTQALPAALALTAVLVAG